MNKEMMREAKELLQSIEDLMSLTRMIISSPEGFDDERTKPAREAVAKAVPVILEECKEFISLVIGDVSIN